MYEVIVLGATFAAAGIACRHKENCLVLERSVRTGYEFFGNDGSDIPLYDIFGRCHTVFAAEVVSVEKDDNGFLCLTHGVDGFRTYRAKAVVDTRCREEMCVSKTYDLLIESGETPAFSNVHWEKANGENRYILRCPVPLDWGYPQARSIARKTVEQFSKTQRLILSADEFSYQLKAGYPKTQNGILLLPSKAYPNPTLAYEAGMAAKVRANK